MPIDPEASTRQPEALAPEVVNADDTLERLNDIFAGYRDCRERTDIWNKWLLSYRAYMGWKPQNSPYRINYVPREIFRQVETLKPQMAKQFFGNDKLFRYLAMHEGGEDAADGAVEVVHQQIRRYHLMGELQTWLDVAILYGTSYLTYGWRTFKHCTRKIAPLTLPQTPKTFWRRKSEERVQEAPYLEFLKPWEVYSHPHVEDVRNSPCVFVLKVVTVDDLKTMVREGYLDADAVRKAVDDDMGGGTADRSLAMYQSQINNPTYDHRLDGGTDRESPHLLRIAYTNDGWEYATLNDHALVRAVRQERMDPPLLALRNYPQPGEHYGIPEPVVILDDQRMLNDVMSMYMDSIHFCLNPMWKVKQGAVQNWNLTTFQPGGKITVGQMDDVMPLEVPPVTMELPAVVGLIRNNMKMATGITDEVAGAGSQQRTATGLVRLQDAAGERIAHKVRVFAPVFEDVYQALYGLNQDNLPEEVAVRILGADGKYAFRSYGVDVFNGDVDVEVELSNVMETSAEAAQKWLMTYRMTAQDPLVNHQRVIERWMKAQGERRPKLMLASSVTAEQDALWENEQVYAAGVIGDPNAGDNHAVHFQIHQTEMATPRFQALAAQYPVASAYLMKHAGIHRAYVQAQQQAAGQAQSGPQQPGGPGAVLPEANARAESMFDNSAAGAAAMGSQEALP